MAGDSTAADGKAIGNSFQKALVSMVRFSSAFTLYGLGELETAISLQEGQGVPEAMRDLEAVLDAMTESLEEHLKQSDREVVKSAKKIATQLAQQSADGLSMMDPRRVVRAANDMLSKFTSEVSKKAEDQKPAEEADRPLLAVEVLTPQHNEARGGKNVSSAG